MERLDKLYSETQTRFSDWFYSVGIITTSVHETDKNDSYEKCNYENDHKCFCSAS